MAAFGAFTEVSYDTPQDLKNTFGHLAYVMAGIASLPSITPYHLRIECDDQVLEDDFFYGMVCNTISVGGMKALPTDRVVLDDGLFEVILVRKPTSITDLTDSLQALIRQEPPVRGRALLPRLPSEVHRRKAHSLDAGRGVRRQPRDQRSGELPPGPDCDAGGLSPLSFSKGPAPPATVPAGGALLLMRLFPRQRDQVPNQADRPLGAHALFKSESMAVCPVLPRGQIGPVPIPLDGHHLFSRTLAPFPAVGSVAAADLLAPPGHPDS